MLSGALTAGKLASVAFMCFVSEKCWKTARVRRKAGQEVVHPQGNYSRKFSKIFMRPLKLEIGGRPFSGWVPWCSSNASQKLLCNLLPATVSPYCFRGHTHEGTPERKFEATRAFIHFDMPASEGLTRPDALRPQSVCQPGGQGW
jgi:hypothetical protein